MISQHECDNKTTKKIVDRCISYGTTLTPQIAKQIIFEERMRQYIREGMGQKMIDNEKIIKGLKCCKTSMEYDTLFDKCSECPYNNEGIDIEDCRKVLSSEALELIELLLIRG